MGLFAPSLADDLYTIQKQIDELVKRIDTATRNAIIMIGLIPESSGLKPTALETGWNPIPI